MKRIIIIAVLVALSCVWAEIPTPKSFYDFEETDGWTVYDGGVAGNNGEIMGVEVERANGGIVTRAGEADGCLEWLGTGLGGELGYVMVPFMEFMNSPNYTLSIWMQYTGEEPDWGYLFWADGEMWEPAVADRHIDVWLSKGASGVDCILHTADEGELRATAPAEDIGIDVYDGEWHQVTVTLQDNYLLTIYVDGLWAAEAETEAEVVTNESDVLWIGGRPNDDSYTTGVKMVGKLDRARIWDVALSPEQVDELFLAEGPDGSDQVVMWQPKSFFDFEGEGTTVTDLGPAGADGIFEGDEVGFAGGGVYAKEGEGQGCVEFWGEAMGGSLSFVRVPYQEFHDSPNYTYSAWVAWNADPNWGYVFWQDGEIYPDEDALRHVDLWFHASNQSVRTILHNDEGEEVAVGSTMDETGVDVFDYAWHHVAVTLENNSIIKVFIDGLIADSDTSEWPIVYNGFADLFLGARPNDDVGETAVKMVGYMDRVRIYDYPLSDAEIEYLFLSEGPDGGVVSVKDEVQTPQTTALHANFPNPFNPTTTVSYDLDRISDVELAVYDMMGRRIRTLVSASQAAGSYQVQWDGTNARGEQLASGVYLYQLRAGERVETRKMMLIK